MLRKTQRSDHSQDRGSVKEGRLTTLPELFWSFFKIGAFTFGSGYAMLPIIEKEVVDRKKWFESEDFYNHLALAQSSPGPIALNTAVFVGYRMRGWVGALTAVLGSVIPCFAIILTIAIFLGDIRDNQYVDAAFKGIRPAVVALIAVPCVRMLRPLKWPFIILGLAAASAIWLTGISAIWFIVAGAAAGIAEVLIKTPKE